MRKALISFVLSAAVFSFAHAALAANAGVGAAAAVSANVAAKGPSAAAEPQAAGFTRWLSTGSVKLPPTQPDSFCQFCAAHDASCCSSGELSQNYITWYCC